jgi:hypothetical protein
MDIKIGKFDSGYSTTVIFYNGNIIVSLGATNVGLNGNPENVGSVDIANMGITVIGGSEFANQLNGIKKSKSKEEAQYDYKRIALHAAFTEFLTDPVWGGGLIVDLLQEAKRDGRRAGKARIRRQLKELLAIEP